MTDYTTTAQGVLDAVGGERNIQSLVHCATRLRFSLRDDTKVDRAAAKAVPGVITLAESGGQFQVVIGNEVPEVFAEISRISSIGQGAKRSERRPGDVRESQNPLGRFVAMISAIFSPLLWALASMGLIKAFVACFTTFGLLSPDSTTYTLLNALSDGFIYFLPLALAVSAAKYFGSQQYTSLAIAGALLYPAITELAGEPGVDFFGVPAFIVSYAYGVIPVIVAVWLQSYIERFLYAKLPVMVRRFLTPMIVVLLLVPFVYLAIGPVATFVTEGVADGITWVFQTVPWLGGAVMGGMWQILAIFGVHSGFTPFFVAEYQEYGFGRLLAPLWAAVLAQAGASIGVWVRTRSSSRRALAGSATVSALLAGVTEPAIYGVNLPLRRPFLFGILGGAVGGAIISGAQVAINAAIVFPSALSIPALTGHGNFLFAILGICVAMLIGFGGTLIFGFEEDITETAPVTEETGDLEVRSPMDGTAIPLSEVTDPAFAGGSLGAGAAVRPSSNTVVAPFDAEVVAIFPTGHAIGLRHADGAEVLIHIGLDTVQLGGKYFTAKVERGQLVKAGEVLIEFDRDAITAEGYDLTTPIVVTNPKVYPTVGIVTTGPIGHGDPLFIALAQQAAALA